VSVLDPPRHPTVSRALWLTQNWCHGRTIDDAPALRHALAVARTLVRHVPHAAPELVAAALLHDAPEFAPPGTDLAAVLNAVVTPGVAPLVHALDAQHRSMHAGHPAALDTPKVTLIAAADKIVAFRALITRANRSGDPTAFWATRGVLRDLLTYFHNWTALAAPYLPALMQKELAEQLTTLDRAIHTSRRTLPQH